MLAKLPEDRYQDCGEMIRGLQESLYGGGDSLTKRPLAFRWELVLTAALVGMLTGILATVLFSLRQ